MNINPAITRLTWNDIRLSVLDVNPDFASIIDSISPDSSFPIYKVDYPYGASIADTKNFYLPDSSGKMRDLSSIDADTQLQHDLAYGQTTMPMGMVLNKSLEYYIDLPGISMIIPWLIYKQGSIFPFSSILNQPTKHNFSPNNLLAISAGSRSTFLLPNIGCNTHHANIQLEFNVQTTAPKSLYEHWDIFKQIASSRTVNTNWQCSVLFFSEKWMNKIQTDPAWLKLKNHLLLSAWNQFDFERNRVYFDIAFSYIQQKRNLKPNPYITDTARHLLTIAMGCALGYTPASNNDLIPVDVIQNAYIDVYGLKKYCPTIMVPSYYDKTHSVYYSMQHPSTYMFSPKSRKASSTLFEMRELEHVMNVFINELSKSDTICSDTLLGSIARDVTFRYFHNETDRHEIINLSREISSADHRFTKLIDEQPKSELAFAEDAKFLRGCVKIG